jgi:hypothetical protein
MNWFRLHIALCLFFVSLIGWGQCPNDNTFYANLTPTAVSNIQTETCAWGGDYFTATIEVGSSYTFSTCGTSWDTMLTLYKPDGTLIDHNDDSCGWQSQVTWTSDYDGVIWILIDEYYCSNNSDCGIVAVTWNSSTTDSGNTTPPNNDTCGNAIEIGCGESIAGYTSYADYDDSEVSDCGVALDAPGVWYSFEGTDQYITFSICGTTNYDSQINVYSGTCGSLICRGGNDDAGGCGGGSELVIYCLAGTTYYLLIQGYDDETGNFTLSCECEDSSDQSQDCSGGITICDDSTFGGNADSYGDVQELTYQNNDCLSVENQSQWFFFSPTTPGTIEFTIDPSNGIDYDFAIWGPYDYLTCPPTEDPLRCTYSALYEPTGLVIGAGDSSEPPSGDAWVEAITVSNDDIDKMYVMLIDNWTADNTAYNFTWNLTGVILNCSIQLPVEFLYFSGEVLTSRNELRWATASEVNNSHFEVERSRDLDSWEVITIIPVMGNVYGETEYLINDPNRPFGVAYYRLKQVDNNGEFSYSDIVSLDYTESVELLSLYPNPTRTNINVSVQSQESIDATFSIFELTGRKVMDFLLPLEAGVNLFTFDISSLMPGLYTIQILDDEQNSLVTEKMFKK